jgi:hypothetical protein
MYEALVQFMSKEDMHSKNKFEMQPLKRTKENEQQTQKLETDNPVWCWGKFFTKEKMILTNLECTHTRLCCACRNVSCAYRRIQLNKHKKKREGLKLNQQAPDSKCSLHNQTIIDKIKGVACKKHDIRTVDQQLVRILRVSKGLSILVEIRG